LLRLPAADGEFDGAFAVESLEHSLLPQHAVRELCRVVRPGGRVLIIDKQRSKQPLSEHQPWEQWFAPNDIAAWLAEACDDVSVAEIPHGRHVRPTGLFLCWQGRRRG
jgi:ubiquinone/menaquinone biosynthesis C-methylase UbiE